MKFRAIPSLIEGIGVVGAVTRGYTFIISIEDGQYRASWKSRSADMKPFGAQPANYIDGSPFASWDSCYEACLRTYKQLRARQ
jgi:hypothetical protein